MKFRKMLMAAVVAVSLLGVAVSAQEVAEENGEPNILEKVTRKLGRGLSNAAFGALEVPIQVMHVNFEEGGIAACTYGVLLGTGYFVLRELTGVAEVATFLIPLPGCRPDIREAGWGYGPIMRPEWIMTPETNAYGFVYQSSNTLK